VAIFPFYHFGTRKILNSSWLTAACCT
jgi:hypothetical protein